ncbi:MAG: hypothetical protein IJL23_04745 [Alphaproteobacteria bacterium]|nr:hypothetical protein [Alphaproteobacteria bacterium]
MKSIFLFFAFLFTVPLFATSSDSDILTAEEILAMAHPESENLTPCATQVFTQALYDEMDDTDESSPEAEIRAWAQTVMFDKDVLEEALDCPELKSVTNRLQTITFTPIYFQFPNGREITINYTTQLKVLDQKLLLADKPSLPNGDPNPRLMDTNDPAKYINTDPAWYAIMVVEHDSLSNFVGPNKNNTLSMKWINDNIDSIYPRGAFCTSKSALANDRYTINQVVHKLVEIENDSNDYYVAGDVNLEWIMYAEIIGEIALTIVTVGAGEAAIIGLKGARATRTAKNLKNSLKALTKLDDVQNYIQIARQITTKTDDIAKLGKYEKTLKKLEKAQKRGKDVKKYEKQIEETVRAAQKVDPSVTADTLNNTDKINEIQKTLKNDVEKLEKDAQKLEKESKNVQQYKKTADSFSDVMKYRRNLRAYRRPQTGNVITRNFKKIGAAGKTLKTANTGAKTMTKAANVARAGMSSKTAKIGDWLIDSTLKNGARIARFERDLGFVYGAVVFLGDLYDRTSNTSQQYSNGIEFKPLCLLSADDLEGQENEVNYGMWLMWTGNSTDAADDDAAYLQAMDFAEKFNYVLNEYQDEHIQNCNVDIYVVRPIIRLDETNPDETTGELFYLFMNDIPWTSAS